MLHAIDARKQPTAAGHALLLCTSLSLFSYFYFEAWECLIIEKTHEPTSSKDLTQITQVPVASYKSRRQIALPSFRKAAIQAR